MKQFHKESADDKV